jgi:predicted phosphoribosyltransferase
MHPNARAFAVPDEGQTQVRQRRVLVLDDSYVSGARSQSAAAALRVAGARAVVILPLGRVLRPDRVAAHAEFLQQLGEPSERCARCLCDQTAG